MSYAPAGADPSGGRNDSPLRWWVLLFAALAVSSSYYESDVIGPIADLLHRQRGFSQSQLGTLNGIINVPSVVLALINGLLIDRYGPARVSLWSAVIGVVGAVLTASAGSYELMVAGRFIFGASEGAIFIALVAVLARWFSRSGIALATALYLSLARVGSYAARHIHSLGAPAIRQWLAAAALAGSGLHRRGVDRGTLPICLGSKILAAAGPCIGGGQGTGDNVRPLQVRSFLLVHPRLARALCRRVLPFRTTYAIEYFQHTKGLTLQAAGMANSWVFFAAIFATPFFGLLADRFGHRALMLTLGTVLLSLTFVVLGLTDLGLWVSTVLMGVSFSLVPAIIWPATTLIVEPRRLGTALGLITVVQALGIFVSNRVAGLLCDNAGAGAENPAGYAVMLWFFGLLSLVALTSAVLLWRREAGPKGHGLEVARAPAAALRATPAV